MGSSNQRDIPEQTISTLALLKLIWPQAPLRTSFNKHSGNQCEKGARQRITGRIVDVSIDRLLMDGDEINTKLIRLDIHLFFVKYRKVMVS